MKRILLKSLRTRLNENFILKQEDEALQKVCDFASELRLLRDVPFSCLIADEKLLPPESIRFFCLDENWLNALTDGAMSIGRIAGIDAAIDKGCFGYVAQTATERLPNVRFCSMHPNHRRRLSAPPISGEVRTGFILRSELVGKWKGLEAFGYHGDTLLEILRMDTLASDILICIFDGKLTRFVISEPKTGLRFGAADHGNSIVLRSLKEEDFGAPVRDAEVDLTGFMDSNGKINVTGLAEEMGRLLHEKIQSPEFAFELIAVAKRAEFLKGGGES